MSPIAHGNAARDRLAIVVPYCGPTSYGGASALAIAIGQRLQRRADVEVLTTCAINYDTWENRLAAGHDQFEALHVRRFPVDKPRDRTLFERLSRELLHDHDAPIDLQERWMRAQGPYSSSLLEYLEVFGSRYDAVLFFSYLYATTYFGLPLVEDRAILCPLAHDEWPMTFSLWDKFFERPRGFIFNSIEERAFVQDRFSSAVDGPVAGVAISPPPDIDPARFRDAFGLHEPFALYLGRIDQAKGCDELLTDYARLRSVSESVPRLVLVGEQHMRVESDPVVVVIGPVDERTKWDALAACDVFIMPSPHESLSIALLEAWSQGKPALVNGRTGALVGQCRRANGGLWYSNADEFSVAFEVLLDADLRASLGERGRDYVTREYDWQRVDGAYWSVIRKVVAENRAPTFARARLVR